MTISLKIRIKNSKQKQNQS